MTRPATTPCSVCSRPFVAGRLEDHERICRRLAHKKRVVYDSQKQRLQDTEHGPLFRRAQHRPAPPVAENRWRQRHENLINAIRSAREVQRHLAAGGRLQDLPPPPPSDYSDYVQCPSCGRKFNQTAAERHIPRCANYQFNKPAPPPAGRPPTRSPQVIRRTIPAGPPQVKEQSPARSPQVIRRTTPAGQPQVKEQSPARSPQVIRRTTPAGQPQVKEQSPARSPQVIRRTTPAGQPQVKEQTSAKSRQARGRAANAGPSTSTGRRH